MSSNKINEIYELTCERCGKKIISLNENQANQNMKVHKIKCNQSKGGIK